MTDPTPPSGPGDNHAPSPEDSAATSSENTPSSDAKPSKNDSKPSSIRSGKPKKGRGGSGGGEPAGPTAVVRYGAMRYVGEFKHSLDHHPAPGTKVVIRTERGVELGEVIVPVSRDDEDLGEGPRALENSRLRAFLHTNGRDYPFRQNGRILRPANQQDQIDHRHLQGSAREAGQFCRKRIADRDLPMNLVTVEHTLGGERIIFYFTAESRVDFRELVRDLAAEFRTRIEMRQVGARDEARLVADYERCGQHCCCRQFLKDLKPVSMRMAKQQKATLDPAKISGRCGRLMCCLRYEDKCYSELRKNLPKRNTWVRTDTFLGRVIEAQTLTQLVKLMLPDNTTVVVSVGEIIERNLKPPTDAEARQANANHAAARRKEIAQTVETVTPDSPSPPPEESDDEKDSSQGEPQKKKRRRRRRSKNKQGSGSQKSGGQSQSSGNKKSSGKSKRRRRRRKKKNPGDKKSDGSG